MEHLSDIEVLLKGTNGAGAFYFENSDEISAYTSLLSRGRTFAVMGSKKYSELCDAGLKYATIGMYEKAMGIFDECLELNPVAVRARFGIALCEIYMDEYDNALIDLMDAFQYITDKESASLLYEYYAKAYSARGDYLAAAACLVQVKEFKSSYDLAKNLTAITDEKNINIELARKRTEFVLREAGIPIIDRKKLLERKRRYNRPFYYSGHNISAVIDGGTRQVITDTDIIEGYDKEDLVAFSFDTLDEALIFASNAKGKNVAQANRGYYLELFGLACDYVTEGRYQEALETFGECFILNPICLDARLNASYFHTYFNQFDEAKNRLDRMYNFIVNNTYAMLFYRYYGIMENAKNNFQAAAACFLHALKFRSDAVSKNILTWLDTDCGVNIRVISKNPELILRNSQIPVLTADEISRRRVYYRIIDK